AVAEDPATEVITHREFIRRRVEAPRWLTRAELHRAAEAIRTRFDYQEMAPGWLSAADVFGALSSALVHRSRTGALPDAVPVRHLLGPPAPGPDLATPFTATAGQVADACSQVEEEASLRHRMPASVTLAGRSVSPAAFLMAMAGALAVTSAHDPVEVAPAPPFPLCQETIYRSIRVRSSELPDDFEEGTIVTHTHLQTWTARPAVRP
ncbi:MAG: hypothetical protein ACOYEW_17400, partial [Anaerolineae bacterium]